MQYIHVELRPISLAPTRTCAEGVDLGRTNAVKSRREPCRLKSGLFVVVAAAVERGPISKWKTDQLAIIRCTRLKASMSNDVVRRAKTDEGAVVFRPRLRTDVCIRRQTASGFAPATATLLAVSQKCGGGICQCLARLHPEGLSYLIGGKYRSDAMAGTSWLHSSPTTSWYSGTMRQVR